MRRMVLTVLIMGVVSCWGVTAEEGEPSIKLEKRGKEDVVKIKGRIKSRHVGFRKGKSVREYYIVTSGLIKIPLPRSHVEHRDGTISGIQLKLWRGKDVELVCEGRLKNDPQKGLAVTVEKIISLVPAKR